MSYIKFEQPQAIEHLVFQVKPERFEEWLALDHELWTLAEAQLCPGLLRKEVWVNQNVQGEVQKKLDIIANEVLIEANEWGGHLVSEDGLMRE